MATAFHFFELFFRLYFWLQEKLQQVIPGQGLQNNLLDTSQSDLVNMSHWSPLTVTAEMVAYPGHWYIEPSISPDCVLTRSLQVSITNYSFLIYLRTKIVIYHQGFPILRSAHKNSYHTKSLVHIITVTFS